MRYIIIPIILAALVGAAYELVKDQDRRDAAAASNRFEKRANEAAMQKKKQTQNTFSKKKLKITISPTSETTNDSDKQQTGESKTVPEDRSTKLEKALEPVENGLKPLTGDQLAAYAGRWSFLKSEELVPSLDGETLYDIPPHDLTIARDGAASFFDPEYQARRAIRWPIVYKDTDSPTNVSIEIPRFGRPSQTFARSADVRDSNGKKYLDFNFTNLENKILGRWVYVQIDEGPEHIPVTRDQNAPEQSVSCILGKECEPAKVFKWTGEQWRVSFEKFSDIRDLTQLRFKSSDSGNAMHLIDDPYNGAQQALLFQSMQSPPSAFPLYIALFPKYREKLIKALTDIESWHDSSEASPGKSKVISIPNDDEWSRINVVGWAEHNKRGTDLATPHWMGDNTWAFSFTRVESIQFRKLLANASDLPAMKVIYHITGVDPGDALNIRAGPGANTSVVVKLSDGTDGITISGAAVMNGSDDWIPISFPGGHGWTRSKYLLPSAR